MKQAAGSSLVRCGSQRNATNNNKTTDTKQRTISNTIVTATVNLLAGQPATAAPNQGDLVVTVTNAGNSGIRNGNSTAALNLSSVQSFLQRIVEENLELEQLILIEGKLAYRLAITVAILDDGGSLLDVCLAAAMAALLDTRLPVQPIIENGVLYNNQGEPGVAYKPLLLTKVPCALTFAGVRFVSEGTPSEERSHHWVADPDSEEQQVQESVATVVVNAAASTQDGDDVLALHLYPTDSSSSPAIATAELAQILHMAISHGISLHTVLQCLHT